MEITKQKIKEVFFNRLKDYGLEVNDISVTNGYYIIDMGEDSVIHFKIKGIRKWLFALWIQESGDKKRYLLNFFGDKIRWIDKFKPSSALLSSEQHSIKINIEEQEAEEAYEIDNMIYDIIDDVLKLKHNRHIAEYGLKSRGDSFVHWQFQEFWYYDIVKPLKHFYNYKVLFVLCNIVQWYLCLKYHKIIKKRKITDFRYGEFRVSPLYIVGVEYRDGVDDKVMRDTYYKLRNSSLVKLITCNGECSFMQYKDSEAKRGFYYKDDN